MSHPRIYSLLGKMGSLVFRAPAPGRWLRRAPLGMNVGPLRAWMSERDFPPPPARSFQQQWRARSEGKR
jgi:hypothetical protein